MNKLIKLSILALTLFIGGGVYAEDFKKEYADDPVCIIKTSKGDIYVELFAKEAPETVKNFIDLAEGKKTHKVDGKEVKIEKNFYDGLIFHRVIKDFMLQGGCPLGTGTGDAGYKFKDEISAASLGLDKEKALVKGQPHASLGIRSQEDFQRKVIMPIVQSMGIKNEKEFKARSADIQKEVEGMTLEGLFKIMGYDYDNKLKSHKPNRGVIAMANSGPKTNGSQFFINLIDTHWLAGKHTVFGKVVKGMDIVDAIAKVEVGEGSKPKEDVIIKSIRVVKAE